MVAEKSRKARPEKVSQSGMRKNCCVVRVRTMRLTRPRANRRGVGGFSLKIQTWAGCWGRAVASVPGSGPFRNWEATWGERFVAARAQESLLEALVPCDVRVGAMNPCSPCAAPMPRLQE